MGVRSKSTEWKRSDPESRAHAKKIKFCVGRVFEGNLGALAVRWRLESGWLKLDEVAHACNPSTLKGEAGGLGIQDQPGPGLHGKTLSQNKTKIG